MKYKIEIWQYHSIIETYESDNINDILDWYNNHWRWTYEMGNCAYEVYENGRDFSFDELYELGFE